MFLILLTFAIFAASICANKAILFTLPAILFVGIRMSSAGTILLFYNWRKKVSWHAIKADAPKLIYIAIFTTYVPAILKAYGLKNLTAAHATLLGSVDPFVTALYLYLLWGEKLTTKKLMGIVLGCAGVIVSLNLSNYSFYSGQGTILPQIALLVSILCSRWGWIMVQNLLRKDQYAPAQLNSIIQCISGSLALATAYFIDPKPFIAISSWPLFIGLLTFTIIVGNVIGYTLYGYVLKHNNATLVSLAGFSIPIMVSIFSWLFIGEPLTARFVLAATIVFSGLLIFYSDEMKKQKL